MVVLVRNWPNSYVTRTRGYSGTSPYGHLTSKKTSPLQSPWLSPKLYSTVQITPCNKVTPPLRSLLHSPVGDHSEVPLYNHSRMVIYADVKKKKKKKKKSMVLYSAISSPLDRSKRFTLSSPDRPVHSDTVLGFSWKHSKRLVPFPHNPICSQTQLQSQLHLTHRNTDKNVR